jgi:hypothetical protein
MLAVFLALLVVASTLAPDSSPRAGGLTVVSVALAVALMAWAATARARFRRRARKRGTIS